MPALSVFMKNFFPVSSLFLLLFLFGFVEKMQACSCGATPSPCQAYGYSQAVFVGETIEVSSTGNKFVFKVKEAFLNSKVGEIITLDSHRPCSQYFEKGETSLVYATGSNGALSASACGRTRSIDSVAPEDLTFLRRLAKQPDGISVLGTAFYKGGYTGKNKPQPKSGIKFELFDATTDQKKVTVTTNAQGNYRIDGLPVGTYKLLPILPDDLSVDKYKTEEFVVNNKGCSVRDYYINNDNRIRGRILDENEEPIKSMWVELVPLAAVARRGLPSADDSVTDGDGKFYFFDIPPGRYLLALNYKYPPSVKHPYATYFLLSASGELKTLDIKPGTEIRDLDVQLPTRLPLSDVSGRITWPNGKPAAGVSLGLRDTVSKLLVSDAETDDIGNFTIKGILGRKYVLETFIETTSGGKLVSFEAKDVIFILSSKTGSFDLVLTKRTAVI